MSGDKELFEMMRNRGKGTSQLPRKAAHFIPEETAPLVLAIDKRIQKIREHMPLIATCAVALSFLIGLSL